MHGPHAEFAGPPMPNINRAYNTRNNLTSMGVFLSNLSINMQRLVPFLTRLGDLLQRENLLITRNDRIETQNLANNVGRGLHELGVCCSPIYSDLLTYLFIGDQIGQ